MKRVLPILVFVPFAAVLFAGCGGGSSSAPVSVQVSASAAQADQGQSVTITATVTNGGSNPSVSWSLSGPGTLSNVASTTVTYNASDSITSPETATITATSDADGTKTASVQITANPLPQITATSLFSGTTGTPYNQSISEIGGSSPLTWTITSGAVPAGLSLGASSGVISGTPTGGGTWDFLIQLTDAAGVSVVQDFALTITSNLPPGNPVPFVNQPLVPSSTPSGGAGFPLIVNGTGFVSGATVNFNGTPLATTFVTSSQLTATVPATSIASAGTASITVTNPTPGGGLSNSVYFPIAASESTLNFVSASGSPVTSPYAPFGIAAADFNGDSKPDLAVLGDSSLAILLGNGDGTFNPASGSPISLTPPGGNDPGADALAVGDFNDDGKLDLAFAAGNSSSANVPVFLGNGDGTFTLSSSPGTALSYTNCALAPADFNRDGNLDLIVGSGVYGAAVLLGYGDAAFTQVQSTQSFPLGCSIAVGDFNGDGILDVAIPSSTGNTVSIYLGNGDGTFTLANGSPITVAGGPQSITVGDFNGDGKLDLAVADGTGNTVTILLGNGDGTFTQAAGSPIAVGNAPDAIVAADFLNNGKLGLAVANFNDNTITILLGNGDGTFAASSNSPIPVGNGPFAIAVADFNGDGRLDLAVSNLNDSTVSILLQQ